MRRRRQARLSAFVQHVQTHFLCAMNQSAVRKPLLQSNCISAVGAAFAKHACVLRKKFGIRFWGNRCSSCSCLPSVNARRVTRDPKH